MSENIGGCNQYSVTHCCDAAWLFSSSNSSDDVVIQMLSHPSSSVTAACRVAGFNNVTERIHWSSLALYQQQLLLLAVTSLTPYQGVCNVDTYVDELLCTCLAAVILQQLLQQCVWADDKISQRAHDCRGARTQTHHRTIYMYISETTAYSWLPYSAPICQVSWHRNKSTRKALFREPVSAVRVVKTQRRLLHSTDWVRYNYGAEFWQWWEKGKLKVTS